MIRIKYKSLIVLNFEQEYHISFNDLSPQYGKEGVKVAA